MLLGRLSTVGRLRVTALACAAAAITLAGCGSSSSNTASSNNVVRAAFVSTGASGYQMRFSLRISSPGLPQGIAGVGTGAFDVRDHSGSLALDMNLGNSPQVVQLLGSSTFHIDEVLAGTTIYVKLPAALTSKVPGLSSKPWLKVDLAKLASSAGVPGLSSLVNNPASSDPGQFLQYLRAAGTVTKQGTAVVNGVRTTQYQAEISLDHVANAVPSASRASAQQAVAGIEKLTRVHQIPIVVWIDGHNLVRRMRVTLNESVAAGQTANTQITVDFLKYGPQPKAAVPPASQVTDASALSGLTG
jgi:hypothetical protein